MAARHESTFLSTLFHTVPRARTPTLPSRGDSSTRTSTGWDLHWRQERPGIRARSRMRRSESTMEPSLPAPERRPRSLIGERGNRPPTFTRITTTSPSFPSTMLHSSFGFSTRVTAGSDSLLTAEPRGAIRTMDITQANSMVRTRSRARMSISEGCRITELRCHLRGVLPVLSGARNSGGMDSPSVGTIRIRTRSSARSNTIASGGQPTAG